MKDLYNILEGLFDIDPDKAFDDKYIAGKPKKWIDWMIENSHPKTKRDLSIAIYQYCNMFGWQSDLNWIDVSKINNMSYLFSHSTFNGDISKWDVSNVDDMSGMFEQSKFTGEHGGISNWNVSKVKNMKFMFANSVFNNDIKDWNVSSVETMYSMFLCSGFNKDISKWNVRRVENMGYVFAYSKFDKDISKWKVNSHCRKYSIGMFKGCPLEYNPPKWY